MIKKMILICLILTLTSCRSQQVNNTKTNKTEQTKTFENAVYEVDVEDEEMLTAIEMAKKTYTEFEKAIKSENPNFKNFTLKKAYESTEGDEHLWIKSVIFYAKKNKYVGIIADTPLHTKKVKFDEIVEVDKNEISDWMYFQDNVVKGGYTLRLLRSRMTDQDRKLFDAESGYFFE
jgi:uncharacterized protein YegJ (DUF2314 family)